MNTTLPGFTILIAALLEIGKRLGWVPDDLGGKIAIVANALLVAGALVAGQLNYDLSSFDATASTVGTLITQLAALGLVSWLTHKGLVTVGLGGR